MPRSIHRWIIVGGLVAAAVVAARAQNLIRNAGFESPLYGGGRNDGAVLNDWNFVTGSGSVVTNPPGDARFMNAQVGQQQYWMSTTLGATATISQISLSLTSGQTYQFSFYLAGLQDAPNAEITANFTDGSDAQSHTFAVMTSGWVLQTWNFTPASTADYTLSLTSPATFNSTIDDLNLAPLSAVPEPTATALALAIGGMGGAMWRRRRNAVGI